MFDRTKWSQGMTDRVTYRHEDGVAYITMDDGKENAMSTAMLHDLGAALDRAQSDKAAVVLRSARQGIFSAGFDLKDLAANDPARSCEMVRSGAELALRLMAFPNPTIGVMEGHAFPMGTFLLLACDVRIGALGKIPNGSQRGCNRHYAATVRDRIGEEPRSSGMAEPHGDLGRDV
jgi:enoyl-CoA hydratase